MSLVVVVAALFSASALAWWATFAWASLPSGSDVFYRWSWVPTLAWFLALLGVPLGLLTCLFRRARARALRGLAACAAILLGFSVGGRIGSWHQSKGIDQLPARAAPLIAGLRAFERDQGRAPETIEELVPTYLAAIPPTGFGGHPRWWYVRSPFAPHPDQAGLYGDNAWALNVYVGARPGPSYRLLYLPDRQYPASARRVGDWALVHH
jgi:hypothetical protein